MMTKPQQGVENILSDVVDNCWLSKMIKRCQTDSPTEFTGYFDIAIGISIVNVSKKGSYNPLTAHSAQNRNVFHVYLCDTNLSML